MISFWILWALGFALTGAVMFGVWSGPFRSVSNLSRWAIRLGIRPVPEWLINRDADRWAFRGGLGLVAILMIAPWLVPSQPSPDIPLSRPDANPSAVAPARPDTRPARHLDAEMQNAILVHIPKTKRVRMVVLKDDAEADQFSWEIDAFLRTTGYTIVSPRLMFDMPQGEQKPIGTAIYPDQNDRDIVIVRIGLNDR